MGIETLTTDDQVGSLGFSHESALALPSTTSLEALQSSEQREMMDLVDRLRRAGLSSVLQLPQLVVSGDQSSGKSSVLEAITEIPFPRKENLCTRFATEIIMRRDAEASISCKINPHEATAEDVQVKLKDFSKSIHDFKELPSLIEEATAVMGLDSQKAFSKDVLSIEICGPNRPQLTLVDLPGLIHSANKAQSEEDVRLIRSLVEDYIQEERTIVLAVLSAKNDFANQVILTKCRQFDPKGARTLGIVTKPDFLRPGSENESTWLDIVLNRDVFLELGWHVLKNRADDQGHFTFDQRNAEEATFLSAGNYKALAKHIKGITALRTRLSQLLFDHLKRELPALKSELDKMTIENHARLEDLGKSRATPRDQKIYLTELFTSACETVRMGVNGNYDNTFFGPIDTIAAVDSADNERRLRAVVQYLNMQFAQRMRTEGHRYSIEKEHTSEDDADKQEESESESPANAPSDKMSRREAVKWVIGIMQRTRGRELQGTFNPMLVNELFQIQSARWESLARSHIVSVAKSCRAFVLRVLDHEAAPDVKSKLASMTILPALKKAQNAALAELDLIIEDKKRHPMTYNHYFTDTLQKTQGERRMHRVEQLGKQAMVKVSQKNWMGGAGYDEVDYISPHKLNGILKGSIEPDMDKVSAEQALDAHDAYYKDELKYFIGTITKQAVERHLMAPLADILSPRHPAGYTDKEIQFLAAEPPEAVRMREYLLGRKKMLEEGLEAFKVALGESV